ncbi:hypothetical protein B1C78_13950 [Thioalkalivibrio denitrificans]|uniref:Peptidase A2 domain-containing protein n=1 Tax=Thioalkalivibrio denitrificans TaxID=108003 RepID=A0A1V3NCL0_9GAMM|nr:retropepsin-like aspartic protease [Thioalkalivibrio denitrificans]OOG22775.1 hypothetical protein B1C78_13950 [Thioalkalivibrio denitrificans]
MYTRLLTTLLIALPWICAPALAGEFSTEVRMDDRGGAAFYVPGNIEGFGSVDLMVDTGSGYMTINEDMLRTLKDGGQARFVRDLRGRLADGSELTVPVYALDAVSIGEACRMRDVEAAVFPGSTRPILGLNVLQRAAPFIFSFDPPRLVLSHCDADSNPGAEDRAEI